MTRSRLASGALVAAVVSGVLVAVPGVSARAAITECPAPLPIAEAVDGLAGIGYTVERGTTADPFTARILGRITDGIGPGIDMIMADLTSPALTRAGGVWAGMSGSPVYTADGRLIGSVSYGLAASSPIAGLTPAANLAALLTPRSLSSTEGLSSPGNDDIPVPLAAARRIARTGAISASAAGAGFHRLVMPVSVAGVVEHSDRFLRGLRAAAGVQVLTGGARVDTAGSSPTEITAGSNFAAALSAGDVSIASVGTTTFVCDGQAVAFGHPFFGLGDVQYSVHPAAALYVQPDLVNGPFKVADAGGPVGVIDRDGSTGLHAHLGDRSATTFPVTSSLVPAGGTAVTGSTTAIFQPYAADISALHLQSNIVRALGAQGPGSAALTFRITGRTAAGSPFTLVRSDHFTDATDIASAAADSLYALVQPLIEQSFKSISLTGVDVTGTVSNTVSRYRVTAVRMFRDGAWVPQSGTVVASAGSTVYRQITLTRYRSSETVIAKLKVRIPARTQGAVGSLTISNGLSTGYAPPEPKSLTGLLRMLAGTPLNDSVTGTLLVDNGATSVATVTVTRVDGAVADYVRDLNVRIRS